MNTDLTKAKQVLEQGGYTCVLCRGEEVLTSSERGIRPLVEWLDTGRDFSDFAAADKVVGRAAAFLYRLLGVKAVFAQVMSEGAIQSLTHNGIEAHRGETTQGIINRTGAGPCPMERAVAEIEEPQEALAAIRRKMQELSAMAQNGPQ